jgi:transposase InsO family protein
MYRTVVSQEERLLVADMHRLALRWPRFGYRRIAALLRKEDWRVNDKRVHRLWKEQGLQIRRKARKRRRMGTSANACHRRRPMYKDHVWGYDFVSERTERGGQMKLLCVVDEFTRECLTIEAARKFTGQDVVDTLAELFAIRGRPKYIRSDNGPEFACKAVRKWLRESGVGTLFIEPGSPWENGYVESFNGKLRDECLNGELFLNLAEMKYIAERWRLDYNHHRPHSMLDWQSPAMYAARCLGRRRPCAAPGSPLRAHPPQHTGETVEWVRTGYLIYRTDRAHGLHLGLAWASERSLAHALEGDLCRGATIGVHSRSVTW